jgi:dipeptidyl aminopeptidase/acylaminoacyl peptidase
MPELSLDNFTAVPRVTGLVLSPDGRRLVLTVETLSADATRFVSALWEVAADGSTPPRRLTFSERGEANPAFLPDGSLVFTSPAGGEPPALPPGQGSDLPADAPPDPGAAPGARPDGRSVEEEAGAAGLWLLPAGGGEARPLLAVPGGIRGVVAARDVDTVVVRARLFPGEPGLDADLGKARRRREAGVSGILYDALPVRWWDRELGPRFDRLLRLRGVAGASRPEIEEITPDAAGHLEATLASEDEGAFAVGPDGDTVITAWARAGERGLRRSELQLIRSGERRPLSTDHLDYGEPQLSPDGRWVVALAHDEGTPERPRSVRLWLCDLGTGKAGPVAEELDVWPVEPRWAPDSASLYFVADLEMQCPVFRYDVATGVVRRLTEAGAFTSLCPSPDGRCVYALRASWTSPPEVVRVGLDGSVSALPTPGLPVELASTVTAVGVEAPDGTPLRGWLVLPRSASAAQPVPLVLWIHGGPCTSWNRWSWRWCPHLLAERGYAVLLPDPALSTGYGAGLVRRAWAVWGEPVMADLLTVLDHVLQRPDLDPERTAAMGGSFGGYMAAWLAGHTDRFRAIVDHAGLWSFEQFQGTTDEPDSWEHQFGSPDSDPERYARASPDRFAGEIRTPMLVIHGARDYRVPISEALHLWYALQRHGVPSQFLYFPDENHWILKPGNARLWYETVLAFLDHHLRGMELRRPELL